MKISIASFVIFAGILLLLSAAAYADFVNTRAFFILRHSIGFTVTLPAQSASTATNTSLPPGNAVNTADIEFNTTNKSYAWINASVAPCCANIQTETTPIFQYTNIGTVPLNISLYFNGTTMPAGVNVTASNGSTNVGSLGNLLATGGVGCGLAAPFAGLTAAPGNASAAALRCKNITFTSSPFISDLQPQQSMSLWVWAFFDNFAATGGTVGTGAVTRNITHISQGTS